MECEAVEFGDCFVDAAIDVRALVVAGPQHEAERGARFEFQLGQFGAGDGQFVGVLVAMGTFGMYANYDSSGISTGRYGLGGPGYRLTLAIRSASRLNRVAEKLL